MERRPTVFVGVASKHGSTREIAEGIAVSLEQAGLDVEIEDVTGDTWVAEYAAYVIGSAIYAGHWTKDARRFLDANETQLRQRPVWLFSSGPVGESDQAPMPADAVAALVSQVDARGHHVFAGRLDRHDLGIGERIVVGALRVPDGDWRDWDDVSAWAHDVARELLGEPAPPSTSNDR